MKETKKQGNIARPPVIVVTGHIDHGKSTLLDYIRKTNVVEGEAGGITQHLSAYEIEHKKEGGKIQKITFLDTPGHAAFSGMRERGVIAADIAILVVSAEDSVKAQTIEALNAIRAGGIPFIVAINKIDKPAANIEKTKNDLLEKEVYLEGYGGGVPYVPVSAKTGAGVPELIDMIALIAEMGEFSYDPGKAGEGIVIESHMDQKRGISATLVVKNGTLKKGTFIVIDGDVSPVRIMENFLGKTIDEAGAGSAAYMAGLSGMPRVGAALKSFENKKEAEKYAGNFTAEIRKKKISPERATPEEGVITATIPLTLKADTQGTLEALEKEIEKVSVENIILKVTQKGIGNVSESDVRLALGVPGAIILGFNVKTEPRGKDLAEREGVTIALFDIIYKLTEWLLEESTRRKPKVKIEETTGKAKIIRCFSKDKDKQVIGGKVTEGIIPLNATVKILRRNFEIGRGKIIELQQQKIKAKEVAEGNEFGMMIDSKMDVAEGDALEAFRVVEK
ncbi:MAG: translation initiation factor IF-2 [Patescibacteria group bacterium]